MKKIWKRLSALALALTMTLGLASNASAAGINGGTNPSQIGGAVDFTGNLDQHTGSNTITITQAAQDKTYFIFKLFDVQTGEDGVVYTITDDAYDYLNPIWDLVDGESAEVGGYVEVDDEYLNNGDGTITSQVRWLDGDYSAAPAFGREILRACVDLVTWGVLTAENEYVVWGSQTADSSTVTFQNLPDGYYVVGTSIGALITVMDGQRQEIEDKSVGPKMEKEVWENSFGDIGEDGPTEDQILNGAGWGKTNDASVGDTVWYKTTIDLEDMLAANGLLEELVNLKRMADVMYTTSATLEYYAHYYDRVDTGLQWTGKDNWQNGNGIQAFLRKKSTGDLIPLTLTSKDDQGGPWIHYVVNIPEESRIITVSDTMLEELVNMKRDATGGTNPSQIGYGVTMADARPYTFHCLLTGIPSVEYEIVYVYSAVVTGNAVVGQQGNVNDGGMAGARSSTTTYVHDFDLVKINSGNEVLSGATFALLDADKNEIPLVYCQEMRTQADERWGGLVFADSLYTNTGLRAAGSNSRWYPNEGPNGENAYFPYIKGGELADEATGTGYYRPATAEEQYEEGFVPAVITAGYVHIQGLDSGTYYLEEIDAPDGYNRLTDPVSFSITADGVGSATYDGSAAILVGRISSDPGATVEGDTYISGGLAIVNLTGVELPHTGGMGTTLFYIVGGMMMAAAGILLVTRKRMETAE